MKSSSATDWKPGDKGMTMKKTYEIHFNGREVNAIGITYPITQTVEAENEEKAILKIYDKFDHIHVIRITEKKEL